jgi:cobalt/nickel transport system ATP-binding protein
MTGPAGTSPGDHAPLPGDAPDGAIFVARDLVFSYLDRFPALNGVDLDVMPGEMVALLGANGSGKSTLLKVLDGLSFPTAGTLHAFGHLVTEANLEDEQYVEAFRSRVGFVFQNSDTQVFSPTVREEVAFGCLQLGLANEETEQRVSDVLAMLGIADLAERAPFQLSGGQKKKVAIASVLVMNPDVLLFDEPTAALDPRSQQWLADLIVELNAAGKTIVYATHDLDVLERIATRCVVFSEDHTILATGAPGAILDDTELLLRANLVHEHSHVHLREGKRLEHSHPHTRGGLHH